MDIKVVTSENQVENCENRESTSDRRIRHAKQLFISFVATIGHINIGFAMAWPNTLASNLKTSNSTLLGTTIHLEDWEIDMTGSIVWFSALLGFTFSGWVASLIGRRKSMIASVVPSMIGWTLIFLAINPAMIHVGRFTLGISNALLSSASRPYVVELSDPAIRGASSLTAELMKIVGGIIAVALGMILSWYYVGMIALCISLFYGVVVLFFLTDSPTYLVVRNEDEKARQVLKKFRSRYADLDDEIKQIKQINSHIASSRRCTEIFTRPVLKRCFIIFGLFIISNFCSTEVIKANALRMLQTSGLALGENLSTILVYFLLLSGNITQAFILDRIGRRKCIISSLVLILFAYTTLGTYTFIHSSDTEIVLLNTEKNLTATRDDMRYSTEVFLDWLPTVCLMIVAFSINMGIGTIPWFLSAEYFPTKIRSQVFSMCILVGALFSFATLQMYSPLQDFLTPAGLYWSYAFSAAVGIVYTYFIVQETKGMNIG